MDTVRVLRIIEYVGPRDAIEQQVANSLHGERRYKRLNGEVVIRAATLGNYPEVLDAPPGPVEMIKNPQMPGTEELG